MDQYAAQRRHGERRRLFDRRSPFQRREVPDRRLGDRRVEERPVELERRQGTERRLAERRAADRRVGPPRRRTTRRRDTPAPYSMVHMEMLRERSADPGPLLCPSCTGRLSLGIGRPRGADTVRRVSCPGCGKAAILTNTRAVRVLVIEQKSPFREGLREILSDAGHDVVEAADAGVGLTAYATSPADVVLVDIIASGRLDAPNFVRRLREASPNARIVAVAGRLSQGTSSPLAIMGGLGTVTTLRMPFAADDVLQAVEAALGR